MTRRLVTGVAGLFVLALGLAGLPAFLLAAHRALSDLMPSLSDLPTALLAPGDGGLFLVTLLGIGWVSWLVFAISVLVEVVSRTRGVRTPHLGTFLPQRTAAWAVTAATLLVTLTPAGGTPPPGTPPAATAITPHATDSSKPAQAQRPIHHQPARAPGAPASESQAAALARSAAHEAAWDNYRVKRGDTLWDIAGRKLDDPTEWPSIAEASGDIRQPGGRHLEDPDLILPGWNLHVPHPDDPTRGAKPKETQPDRRQDRPPATQPDDAAQPTPPALPTTPLRPAGHTSEDTVPSDPVADRDVARLRGAPSNARSHEDKTASVGHVPNSARGAAQGELPSTPLRPGEPIPQVDSTTTHTGELELPDWVCEPLVPARFEDAPAVTRSQVMAALAAQRRTS